MVRTSPIWSFDLFLLEFRLALSTLWVLYLFYKLKVYDVLFRLYLVSTFERKFKVSIGLDDVSIDAWNGMMVLRGLRMLAPPKEVDPRWHFDHLVKTRCIQVQCDPWVFLYYFVVSRGKLISIVSVHIDGVAFFLEGYESEGHKTVHNFKLIGGEVKKRLRRRKPTQKELKRLNSKPSASSVTKTAIHSPSPKSEVLGNNLGVQPGQNSETRVATISAAASVSSARSWVGGLLGRSLADRSTASSVAPNTEILSSSSSNSSSSSSSSSNPNSDDANATSSGGSGGHSASTASGGFHFSFSKMVSDISGNGGVYDHVKRRASSVLSATASKIDGAYRSAKDRLHESYDSQIVQFHERLRGGEPIPDDRDSFAHLQVVVVTNIEVTFRNVLPASLRNLERTVFHIPCMHLMLPEFVAFNAIMDPHGLASTLVNRTVRASGIPHPTDDDDSVGGSASSGSTTLSSSSTICGSGVSIGADASVLMTVTAGSDSGTSKTAIDGDTAVRAEAGTCSEPTVPSAPSTATTFSTATAATVSEATVSTGSIGQFDGTQRSKSIKEELVKDVKYLYNYMVSDVVQGIETFDLCDIKKRVGAIGTAFPNASGLALCIIIYRLERLLLRESLRENTGRVLNETMSDWWSGGSRAKAGEDRMSAHTTTTTTTTTTTPSSSSSSVTSAAVNTISSGPAMLSNSVVSSTSTTSSSGGIGWGLIGAKSGSIGHNTSNSANGLNASVSSVTATTTSTTTSTTNDDHTTSVSISESSAPPTSGSAPSTPPRPVVVAAASVKARILGAVTSRRASFIRPLATAPTPTTATTIATNSTTTPTMPDTSTTTASTTLTHLSAPGDIGLSVASHDPYLGTNMDTPSVSMPLLSSSSSSYVSPSSEGSGSSYRSNSSKTGEAGSTFDIMSPAPNNNTNATASNTTATSPLTITNTNTAVTDGTPTITYPGDAGLFPAPSLYHESGSELARRADSLRYDSDSDSISLSSYDSMGEQLQLEADSEAEAFEHVLAGDVESTRRHVQMQS